MLFIGNTLMHYFDLVTYSLSEQFLKYRWEASVPEVIGQCEVRFQHFIL